MELDHNLLVQLKGTQTEKQFWLHNDLNYFIIFTIPFPKKPLGDDLILGNNKDIQVFFLKEQIIQYGFMGMVF